ncbi:hypothetical protein EJ05DRAFT_44988 [Pseudovirgaria hyperparasitica]|uniref:Uncharacterized protein n=1 Tax=Pseudovirgaria hyperparasitica TaxID=470096 RepID=A0A6A6W4C9_9PEZI|nr:uncharacterized protein EJ05DRAFT_44988 [Pseudovirgaria hyperparasitica]KAF2756826.1 hypothetical protein EJ05DRAFT_44988 [Pseudovirgaria hyperparasitica]
MAIPTTRLEFSDFHRRPRSNSFGQPGPLHIDIPSQPLGHTYDTTFHGSCSRCHHWHDGIPFKVLNAPEEFTGLHCHKCNHKMCGLGRTSTHASLASQNTIPDPLRYPVESEILSGTIAEQHEESESMRHGGLAISIADESGDSTFDDVDHLSCGRDRKSQASIHPPSPSLLSPNDFHDQPILRDYPGPPPNDVEEPLFPHSQPSELPRRGFFKDKLKKGIKRAVNKVGYDIVRLSPTSPHEFEATTKPPVIGHEGASKVTMTHGVHSQPSPPPSPETRISPRLSPVPRLHTYKHPKGHIPPTDELIHECRQAMTTKASAHRSVSAHPTSYNIPLASSVADDNNAIEDCQLPSNNSQSGRSDSYSQHQDIVYNEDNSEHQSSSLATDRDRESGIGNEVSDASHRSMTTTAISSQSSAGHPSISDLPDFALASPGGVSGRDDQLFEHVGSQVLLAEPYPSNLRISTDSEGLGIQLRYDMPQDDTNEEDGGLTPVAANGGGSRRSSLPFLEPPVSPEDIIERREQLHNGTEPQLRGSIDNDSLTANYGSETPHQDE